MHCSNTKKARSYRVDIYFLPLALTLVYLLLHWATKVEKKHHIFRQYTNQWPFSRKHDQFRSYWICILRYSQSRWNICCSWGIDISSTEVSKVSWLNAKLLRLSQIAIFSWYELLAQLQMLSARISCQQLGQFVAPKRGSNQSIFVPRSQTSWDRQHESFIHLLYPPLNESKHKQ